MKKSPLTPPTSFGSVIVKIALVMFVVELLIMLGFFWFEIQVRNWRHVVADAVLLAVIATTIAYFLFVRPRDRQIHAVLAALEEAKLNAEHLARFDVLTGVLSRRALLEALRTEVESARRYDGTLACLMIDLDHFKIINDTYGHQFGDGVLRQIARVISEHCRTNDHLGRYGGEEFMIVLPKTQIDGATQFAERVRAAVANTPLDGDEERITLSIGVAEWRDGDGSMTRLISQADQALLEAKSAGRNRVKVKQPV